MARSFLTSSRQSAVFLANRLSGFGNDVINLPVLAVPDHLHQRRPEFLLRTGDALVIVEAGEFPVGIGTDVLLIMALLGPGLQAGLPCLWRPCSTPPHGASH